VVEAIIRAAVITDPAIVEEVAKSVAPRTEDWESFTDTAIDALNATQGIILSLLDPLP
jgi:hypothetical protein